VRVKLRFRKNIIANVIGTTASDLLHSMDGTGGQNALTSTSKNALPGSLVDIPLNSILVTENFTSQLVSASELSTYTKCKFNRILQRMIIPIPQGLGFVTTPQSVKNHKLQVSALTAQAAEEAQKRMTEQLLLLMIDNLEEVFDNIDISSTADDKNRCVIISVLNVSFRSMNSHFSELQWLHHLWIHRDVLSGRRGPHHPVAGIHGPESDDWAQRGE
jgi:hypothetical protein